MEFHAPANNKRFLPLLLKITQKIDICFKMTKRLLNVGSGALRCGPPLIGVVHFLALTVLVDAVPSLITVA